MSYCRFFFSADVANNCVITSIAVDENQYFIFLRVTASLESFRRTFEYEL